MSGDSRGALGMTVGEAAVFWAWAILATPIFLARRPRHPGGGKPWVPGTTFRPTAENLVYLQQVRPDILRSRGRAGG